MRSLRHSFFLSLGAHALALGAVVAAGWAWHEARMPAGESGDPNVLTVLGLPEEPAPQPAGVTAPPAMPAVAAAPPPVPSPPVSAPPPAPPLVAAAVTPPIPETAVNLEPAPPVPVAPTASPSTAAAASETAQAVAPVNAPPSVPASVAASSGTGQGAVSSAGGGSVTRPAPGEIPARPEYRRNPKPDYPLAARRRGQEGLVLLRVVVSAKGRAARVELKQSSGYASLDDAAIHAVREWDFEPARLGPLPVESEIEVPVRFRLPTP